MKPLFTLDIVPADDGASLQALEEYMNGNDLTINNVDCCITQENLQAYKRGDISFLNCIFYFDDAVPEDDILTWMAGNVWKRQLEESGLTIEEFVARIKGAANGSQENPDN